MEEFECMRSGEDLSHQRPEKNSQRQAHGWRNLLDGCSSLEECACRPPLSFRDSRILEDFMQSSATSRHSRAAGLELLKDSRLLREFAYIGGAWQASASGRF